MGTETMNGEMDLVEWLVKDLGWYAARLWLSALKTMTFFRMYLCGNRDTILCLKKTTDHLQDAQ